MTKLQCLLWLTLLWALALPATAADEPGSTPDNAVFAEVFNTAIDSEPWLNLRKLPVDGSPVIEQMLDGTKLKVLDKQGWWKVEIIAGDGQGSVGWAHPKWLRPVDKQRLLPPQRVPTSAAALEAAIQRNPSLVQFHGTFTEPFFSIFVTADEVLIRNIGVGQLDSFILLNAFDPDARAQTLLFSDASGKLGIVLVKKEPGSDYMSTRVYAYTVRYLSYWGGGEGRMIHR